MIILFHGAFEHVGCLKGKRWYRDADNNKLCLFKPQRNVRGNKRIFCANHYGELVGYLLANNADIPACKVELAQLSRYFPDKQKARYGNPEEKKGCITYKEKNGQLKPGSNIIEGEKINRENSDLFEELLKDEKNIDTFDNIEVIFKSIELLYQRVYADVMPSDAIKEKIQSEKARMIQMMVFDCLYGNNDRHDENWSFIYNKDNGLTDINLYPLYDNERVLGLYESQDTIERILNRSDFDGYTSELLFSRMRVPGEKKKYSTYKDVLTYLLKNYPEVTSREISNNLNSNTKETVKRMLEECEGLPQCYIDFGSKLYETRYNFAKELIQRFSTQNKYNPGYKNSNVDYLVINIPNGISYNNRLKYETEKKDNAIEYPSV